MVPTYPERNPNVRSGYHKNTADCDVFMCEKCLRKMCAVYVGVYKDAFAGPEYIDLRFF